MYESPPYMWVLVMSFVNYIIIQTVRVLCWDNYRFRVTFEVIQPAAEVAMSLSF